MIWSNNHAKNLGECAGESLAHLGPWAGVAVRQAGGKFCADSDLLVIDIYFTAKDSTITKVTARNDFELACAVQNAKARAGK